MKINQHNIEGYKNDWQENRICTITNFLVDDDCEELLNHVMAVSDDKWIYSIHPFKENWYQFENTPDNQTLIKEGIASANDAYLRKEFSYVFKRNDERGEIVRPLLASEEFATLIKQITNKDISHNTSTFASKYECDFWLSSHTDVSRGKIAFVLNLTKDWKETYGGNFVLQDSDNWSNIKRRIIPTFNSLTIFDVEGSGQPHYVEKVLVNKTRYAISGWLS